VDPYGVHGERVVAAADLDHIIPHKGDMTLFWDPTNWQGLCKGCHSRKTATEDSSFASHSKQ
jgi:5-methylcytosine-specific restriction protein A